MSGKKKRGLKYGYEQALKRIKLFSRSDDPRPSAQPTQQANTTLMPGSNRQPMSAPAEPSSLPPVVPLLHVEPYGNTPNPLMASTSHAPPTAEQHAKRERWAELKALSNILGKGFENFGPLKQAVEGIVAGVEIFETAAQNRADYETLRNDLNGLFHDLAEFFDASTPPVMAPSIINFAQGIDRELELVRLKLSETRIGTHQSDADKILEHYRRIQTLLQRLTSNVGFKTLKIVDEQATEARLGRIPHSPAAKYNSAESSDLRGRCTENTRVQVLEEIYEWACDDKSQKIYWLNGMAGTGKTTIAYSFCERLELSKKLAASFFCSRQLPSCREVNRIVPTMSYQLSRFSRPFRSVISRALEEDPDVHNQVLLGQFKNLILKPLAHVKDTLPIDLVVVVDALDECENNGGVERMLNALFSCVRELPVKFFVASRPDPGILDRMRGQHGENITTELRLHELDRPTVQEDIKTYLTTKLVSHMNLSASNLDTLAKRSGVLFIYASTVARYLENDNFSRAHGRLEEILEVSNGSSSNSEKDTNDLYTVILEAALNNPKLTSRDKAEIKLVLDTVVCAQEPLSVYVMGGLLGLSTIKVRAALRPLLSVLHVSDMTGHRITTLHESFPDYLLDKNRSGAFHCDASKHHTHLAQLCFMHIKLPNPPFNICNLESSYVFDKDVPDLPARVKKTIPKQLVYACRYWASHCMSAEESKDLASMLWEFASERFLLWIEVVNLSKCLRESVKALYKIRQWAISADYLDEDIRKLLGDMCEFATSFSSTPAMLSTPHLYVSTLTFWRDQSPITEYYGRQRQGLITEQSTARMSKQRVIMRHREVVGSVAYSPDGAYVVFGCQDRSIRIWGAHTGRPIGQPLQGHTDSVYCVAYSPDGTCIVSGSKDMTIRIWDAKKRQLVGQPLYGHTGFVESVAYSPDGAYIVSGSQDMTIRIWNAYTHQPVGHPLKGHIHWVTSVACSPDGAYIASGSPDRTIRVWDARTGQPVGQPLEGHTGTVHSVTYSPNGAYIASGSLDKTIRVWDAQTGQAIGRPLQGHDWSVVSVAYSPDGAYIVSGSWDKSIRIWDAHTGQAVGQPLWGHADIIYFATYSPDGAFIASGSDDKTIRIWDAHTDPRPLHDTPELIFTRPRTLCNLGCQFNCPHTAWTLNEDGWIVSNNDKLIWVPPDLRMTLVCPQNIALSSTLGFLQLDLDHNKLGEHWHKYFCPENSIDYD